MAEAPLREAAADAVTLTGERGHAYALADEPLAIGGQGSVWLATRDDGVQVAIKVAHGGRGAEEALTQEADLLAGLAEAGVPGVVALLDRVRWEGRAGFVMPHYPATAEAHVLSLVERWGGLAAEAVLAFAVEVARALHALHKADLGRQGVLVHRDIKPENLLVDASGQVYMADLGGTLLVDPTVAVRLAVFGTPLWAPYDQLLPGVPDPGPTWDTYALCVCLFWWLTGARPAYQADPSPMLTRRGREIWTALTAVATAQGGDPADLAEAHRRLSFVRAGTREADLVEVRGHSAIQPEDVAALTRGLARLASAEHYGADAIALCVRDLERVLARGLSPLSHPSPPNRFWDAAELASEIDAARLRLVSAREARALEADRAALSARVASMERLPATALPIRDEPSTEEVAEPGIDPTPREVRAPRPPTERPAERPNGALWGVLLGLVLFGLACIPLVWKLMQRQAAQSQAEAEEAAAQVLVPAGAFVFGDVWGDGAKDERPSREVTLGAFRMDRTEVSNAAWARCQAAGACPAPAWADPARAGEFTGLTGPDQPAVGVTHTGASAYCAWAGGRLPTEEEWEKAATWGPQAQAAADKRRWPWGEAAPDCTRAWLSGCAPKGTHAVEGLSAGASAYGVEQLVGNALEWTSSTKEVVVKDRIIRDDVTATHHVLRGGDYLSEATRARTTLRRHAPADEVSPIIGFRCVIPQDAAPAETP